MIELIELPELTAIGIMVEAPEPELAQAISRAWTWLFETETGASSFLAASIGVEGAIHRELVGFLAARKTDVPPGMILYEIPAQRYLRIGYEGPVSGIADGFAQLYAYAAARGLTATEFKLDFGYIPGLPAVRHELHVALAPEILRLG
ncbi:MULTISPECIES: GyrI-like domain-containing protein [unclassified Devosia]|uniref:GyrI-like domain-containing protein n=1 Tax=unclassified Devosia TaxID=196773 RepID=UPI001557D70E|nr:MULTISPECIES: GyrI-like domain-containing protein [unclassified Devosia]